MIKDGENNEKIKECEKWTGYKNKLRTPQKST